MKAVSILRSVFVCAMLVAVLPSAATADWDEGDDHKMHWPQLPDLSTNGMDVNATQPNFLLADDFLCTASGPITNIHIWGSWLADVDDADAAFVLSIHEDIPDPDGEGPEYSMPGTTLWFRAFPPGSYTARLYAQGLEEGWMDPPDQYLPPGADTECCQYNFALDPQETFTQQVGKVYWLDVQAIPSGAFVFGWKTTTTNLHWNDDATWTPEGEPNPSGWVNLVYPPDHPFKGQTLDMAFVIDGEHIPTPDDLDVKWRQPLDEEHAVDVTSYYDGETMTWLEVFDDFLCDGRPIDGVRWWGSYIGYSNNVPGPVPPPSGQEHPTMFYFEWYTDMPANSPSNTLGFSHPDQWLWTLQYALGSVVTETYRTSVWHEAAGEWEHEFEYEVLFDETWNEKEGEIYWIGIQADYGVYAPTNPWGWATAPMRNHWNDDAVLYDTWNPQDYTELTYDKIDISHPYGTNSVAMAFELLTTVKYRRAKKWFQPPDMEMGENMFASVSQDHIGQNGNPIRADDFVSDGRRITDIHWWGSYLAWWAHTNETIEAPQYWLPHAAPLGFLLSWHTDIPTNETQLFSMPSNPPIEKIFVPLSKCHEVYYGPVFQWWKPPPFQWEHEYQYYVDLLDPEIDGDGWPETNGVIYWLDIQAVFTNGWTPDTFPEHDGWGWKTTSPEFQWNDTSVVATNYNGPLDPLWEPAYYPPWHPMVGQPMDLAFELTTDEVGTNQWYTPISIKKILTNSPTDYVVKSVGDWGSGKQLLQYCTNLVVSNWVDLATNTLPLPPPYTNTWNANSMPNSNAFFRVLQRR